jgi:amino acid transporter
MKAHLIAAASVITFCFAAVYFGTHPLAFLQAMVVVLILAILWTVYLVAYLLAGGGFR